MVRTYGLTHLAFAVRDPHVSARFYVEAFGGKITYEHPDSVQVDGPGEHDILVFDRDGADAGRTAGLMHFGLRLRAPEDVDPVVEQALAAGGTLLRRGEFSPGHPFAYVADPDGYEIELWYE